MLKYISFSLGISVFVLFMILAGNLHYIETIIGLSLGVAVGFGLYFKFRRK